MRKDARFLSTSIAALGALFIFALPLTAQATPMWTYPPACHPADTTCR